MPVETHNDLDNAVNNRTPPRRLSHRRRGKRLSVWATRLSSRPGARPGGGGGGGGDSHALVTRARKLPLRSPASTNA